TGAAAPACPGKCEGLQLAVRGAKLRVRSRGTRLAGSPGWTEGQDLLDRWWLWLGRPLSALLPWPVLRPLRAFCPRLASLSYSADARVRAVLTYPLARVDSVFTEASSRHLASQAVSSRSVSEATTPTPAAACTGLLSASLRISVLTSMVRFITYLTLPGLNGQACLGGAPALPRRGSLLVGPVGPVAGAPDTGAPDTGAPDAGPPRGNAPQIGAVAACAPRARSLRAHALGDGACSARAGAQVRGLNSCGRLRVQRGFPAERFVDLQQHLLLPLGELRVGEHRCPYARVRPPVLQDPRLHVKCLGGDAQPLGDLLQDLGAGTAQPPLDLAEVGVGDAGGRRRQATRDLRLLTLLADVLPDGADVDGTHLLIQPQTACNSKH